MSREKIARALTRRPGGEDFRKQVFWLVDVIYACKASQDEALVDQSKLLEDALGCLGRFLETGDEALLSQTHAHLDAFGQFVRQPPKPQA